MHVVACGPIPETPASSRMTSQSEAVPLPITRGPDEGSWTIPPATSEPEHHIHPVRLWPAERIAREEHTALALHAGHMSEPSSRYAINSSRHVEDLALHGYQG